MLDPEIPEARSPVKLAERLAAQLTSTISARRSALVLTQAQLAERLDIATKTVSGFDLHQRVEGRLGSQALQA